MPSIATIANSGGMRLSSSDLSRAVSYSSVNDRPKKTGTPRSGPTVPSSPSIARRTPLTTSAGSINSIIQSAAISASTGNVTPPTPSPLASSSTTTAIESGYSAPTALTKAPSRSLSSRSSPGIPPNKLFIPITHSSDTPSPLSSPPQVTSPVSPRDSPPRSSPRDTVSPRNFAAAVQRMFHKDSKGKKKHKEDKEGHHSDESPEDVPTMISTPAMIAIQNTKHKGNSWVCQSCRGSYILKFTFLF